ncbi:MAG: hypothetical protein SGARI_001270, partial [Bacillariaceae sp.]
QSNVSFTKAPSIMKAKKLDEEDGSSAQGSLSKDDDLSSANGSGSRTSTGNAKTDQEMENDSKCMRTSRIMIIVALLITGAVAGGITYYFVKAQEQAQFEDDVSTTDSSRA